MAIPESYPDNVRLALTRMLDGLKEAEPKPVAVAVYGSLAKGTYIAGASDVNVVVVLGKADDQALSAIRGPLRAAWLSVRLKPYLLAQQELARLTDAFPIKIADMVEHHDLIMGESDPFVGVVVERRYMRLRIEQALRNHLMRLRRHYMYAGDDQWELAKSVVGSISSLGIELGALLQVSERPSGNGRLESVRDEAAEALSIDPEIIDRLCAYKRGAGEKNMRELFFGLMNIVERAVEVADELEVGE